jgi:hypothetical protein
MSGRACILCKGKSSLVDGIQRLVPASDSGDDAVWICGPGEGLRIIVSLGKEAIDGSLQVDDGSEDVPFQSAAGEFGEEVLDGIEP